MALSAGTRLGSYEILEPLGAGGMGEVYRAHDPRLKRDVALKVLPAELASEPERLERFQREAETLAALNHPHIVTIFSVEEAEEHRFLTMELVAGKTLSKVIPRGGLPLSRFFPIAVPLAEAVSAAHEKGIIHRDLKPGNVMVTEEGRVKVLDFGLAKLREGVRGGADSQSPTEPATGPGRVLGTAPYMSPEQVQGKALGHRSDVFALGIMLYEMATGERPFAGDTFAEVASSILRDTPPSVTERKPDLPRDLGKLIKHCLEKEPRKRFQSTLDLANELEELRREVDSGEALASGGAPLVTSRAGGSLRVWLVAGAAVATLALGVGYLLATFAARPDEAQFEVKPITSDGGHKEGPALSPDGELVAYSWTGTADDNWDIYVRALGPGTSPLRLTSSAARDRSPVWSPDGRRIAFVRDLEDGSAIFTVPWPSGPERRLVRLTGPTFWYSPDFYFVTTLSWSPDGDALVYSTKPSEDEPARLVRLVLSTLEEQTVSSPPRDIDAAGDFFPAVSPDGSLVAFVRWAGPLGQASVWVRPLGAGQPRRVTSGQFSYIGGLAWTPDGGAILFTDFSSARHTILRVDLAGGQPQPLQGLGEGAGLPSIRAQRLVYRQETKHLTDLWRVPGRATPVGPREPEKLIASSRHDENAAYSPDGRKIAFSSSRSGPPSIWVCDSDGSHPVQLTNFESWAGTPRWSPDGRKLVFDSLEAGNWDIYVIDASGGVPRRMTHESSADNMGSWSRDGRWIYFASDRGGSMQTWKVSAEGGEAVQVTRGGGLRAEESWDGRHLYYYVRSTRSIRRIPVDGGDETGVVSGPIPHSLDWAVSRSGIYFATETPKGRGEVYVIHYLDFESGQVTELYRREGPFGHITLAVAPGEEWILFAETRSTESELMLMEGFR